MSLLPTGSFDQVFSPLRGKRVALIDGYGNLGDQLIYRATRQLLDAFGVAWHAASPRRRWPDLSCIDEVLAAPDVELVLLFGGGNMGSPYVASRRIRQYALDRATRLKLPCIVLPQSFMAPEPGTFERVYVRERHSLRHCPEGILAPDLALGLDIEPPNVECTASRGIFLRRDREAFVQGDSDGDPAARCGTVEDYLRLAARHHHVITDRLHFAICALLCGCQTTLLPGSYHKNRGMWEAWLADLGCNWADSLEQASKPVAHLNGIADATPNINVCSPSMRRSGLPEKVAVTAGQNRRTIADRVAGVWVERLNSQGSSERLSLNSDARFLLSLLPSMVRREPVAMPVSPHLAAASTKIMDYYATRWPKQFRRVPLIARFAGPPPHGNSGRGNGAGLLFTGGVDSWHTLLEHEREVTHLICVLGCDVPLNDAALQRAVSAMLHRVGDTLGKTVVLLRTNLRQRIGENLVIWRHYFVPALIATCMLLPDDINTLYVSGAGYPRSAEGRILTGANPELDPLYSTEYLDVKHAGAGISRLEKTRRVAQSPLAMRTLRPCWRQRGGEFNCGKCEKCLRTMAALQRLGALRNCRTLPCVEAPIGRPEKLSHFDGLFWDELEL